MEKFIVVYQAPPFLLRGIITTMGLVRSALISGFMIGVPLSVEQVYGSPCVRRLIGIDVWFFRGLPILVLLFLFYYGLFTMIGLNLSTSIAAVLVLGLRSSAYQSQIFRGSIQSLGEGQMLAAQALGMSRLSAVLNIVLPQALRRAIPGCSNEMIYLIKYSSLAFMVTCIELTGAGKIVASRYFTYTEVFLVIGIIYLLVVSLATKLLNLLEVNMAFPGWGVRK